MKESFEDLRILKEKLCKLRLDLTKQNKSDPWSVSQLDAVLKRLKSDKSCDPYNLVNEIFKPGIIGPVTVQGIFQG